MRRAPRIVLLAGVTVAFLLAATPRSDAHALLQSSDPADGVSLRAPPPQISLTFTEEPDPTLSSIEVLDASGTAHQREPASASSDDPRTLRVAPERLREGVYTVSWRVVSRADGHATAGAFAFGIGVDPAQIRPLDIEASTPPLSPLEPAGRFGIYAGLALVIGAAWVTTFVYSARPRASFRLLPVGVAVGAAGVVLLAIAQLQASGASIAALSETTIGRAIVARGALLVVALASIILARLVPRARTSFLLLAIAAATTAMAFHVASGHAAADANRVLDVTIQLVHFCAVAVWIGGLAALLAGIRQVSVDDRRTAVRRFSTVAGAALAVVVATGTARGIGEVGSWNGLVSTGYGRIVLAKIAGFAVLVGLGARNRWWNVAEVDRSLTGFRRVSRGELVVAVAVLALTGTLSSLVPARSAALAQASTSITLEGSDFARTVEVALEITPGYPGANAFIADVQTLAGGRGVRSVRVRLASPRAGVGESTLRLHRRGGRWHARAANIGVAGLWRAVVLVDRGSDSAEVAFGFHTRCRTQAAPTSGQPTIHTIELGSGRQAQGYVDPGRAGPNDVHFTFFDANGNELPLEGTRTEGPPAADPAIDAIRDRRVRSLDVRRLSAGHFVAGGRLSPGRYVFEIRTETSEEREPLTVCFEETVS